MVLLRWLVYFADGYWDGVFDNSVVIRHSWRGIFSNRLINGTVDKLEFESGVTKNLFTEENQKYLKSVKTIVFHKNKNSEYVREQMIIPDNVKDITIYYYGSKPSFDFKFNKKPSIDFIDMDDDNTDYVANFDRYEDRRGGI